VGYEHAGQGRQILNDAEDDLRDWQPGPDTWTTPGQSPAHSIKGKEREVTDYDEVTEPTHSVADTNDAVVDSTELAPPIAERQ
jgi:hypothetical protein